MMLLLGKEIADLDYLITSNRLKHVFYKYYITRETIGNLLYHIQKSSFMLGSFFINIFENSMLHYVSLTYDKDLYSVHRFPSVYDGIYNYLQTVII